MKGRRLKQHINPFSFVNYKILTDWSIIKNRGYFGYDLMPMDCAQR